MFAQRLVTYIRTLVAREVSSVARYFDVLGQPHRLPSDNGELLDLIDCGEKRVLADEDDLAALRDTDVKYVALLLNGTLNHELDIAQLLTDLRAYLTRTSRVIIVAYNPYLRPIYRLAGWLGVRSGEVPSTFVTQTNLRSILRVAEYDIVRIRPVGYFPLRLFGLGTVVNRLLSGVPWVRWFGLTSVITLRPIIPEREKPSLSVIIPARNEMGNIEDALKRLDCLEGVDTEIVFVEGHSTDETWKEILRVREAYKDRYDIQARQQTGRGKNDAVRLGFSIARRDLLTILDADLTMPPELLRTYYDVYCRGLGDFINGNRLVYPMEGEAMRFLNRLGNIFFAKALSSVLDTRLGDSLCGTKLLSRADYERVMRWRGDFGDFDPFGDFELLFAASILGLGIVDVPIHYRTRTYGDTNISRFRPGLMLFKMVIIGTVKVRCGIGR